MWWHMGFRGQGEKSIVAFGITTPEIYPQRHSFLAVLDTLMESTACRSPDLQLRLKADTPRM